jgi:hypothetical protein
MHYFSILFIIRCLFRYFGGGTLLSGAADTSFMVAQPKTTSKHYEDGTINFHGIAGEKSLLAPFWFYFT